MTKPLNIDSSVSSLAGVGPQTADKLARLHIKTVQDVLFHLPLRYEDRTRVTPVAALLPGQAVVVIGRVEHSKVVFGRRRSLLVSVVDDQAYLQLRFFYFNRSQENAFRKGKWVRCFGEVRRGPGGLEMVHPEYRISSEQPVGGMESTLTPVYPTVEGLSQTLWRKLTDQALSHGLDALDELIPSDCVSQSLATLFARCSTSDALKALHRPSVETASSSMANAQSPEHVRLIVEELLAHHFSYRRAKLERSGEKAVALTIDQKLQSKFAESLGFTLTGAQDRVIQEVFNDLVRPFPAMRLIQGDVGSGKTVIAAAAALQAQMNGLQVAFMAPTELLAEQHFKTLTAWFEPHNVAVGFLASRLKQSERRSVLDALSSGALSVVVGTHALIQESVEFANLGLVVIDEQHRFGVAQRLALRSKSGEGQVPHQLAMTATPIPRTLAMTFYADLDVSSVDELPPGRQVVETMAASADERREQVIARVAAACRQSKQAYWVCPLIHESDALEAQAAEIVFQELREQLNDLKIGLVHGRLKAQEKELVMQQFRDGQLSILVATTVIEVGVDVPNASLMVIENAERLGLAQLHQLRGRVGRGSEQSYCVLLYQSPLSANAKTRLQTLRDTTDGFVIAEKDLEIRGAGELLGTRQTGSLSFRVADVMRDQSLLAKIEPLANQMIEKHPHLIPQLIDRWIGTRENFVNA